MPSIHKTIFSSIVEVYERIKDEIPRNPLGIIEGKDQYNWIDWSDEDGKGRIMSSWNSPFVSPFLFRGQIKRHDPCLPKIYRDFPLVDRPSKLSERHRDYYLLCQIFLAEFYLILEQHPAVQYADEIGLHLSPIALAQHYGIPTNHLDLTQDPEVAAFFATCSQDEKGNWIPEEEGYGVLYRFHFGALLPKRTIDEKVERFFQVLEMIGLQTFPRPGEQKAWTIKLPLGFDFHRMPMDPFVFKHSKQAASIFYDKFDQGRALFPPDRLADFASMIINADSLSSVVVKKVFLEHNCHPQMVDEALSTYTKRFKNYFIKAISNRDPLRLSVTDLDQLRKDLELKRHTFLQNVGVRAVKTTHVPTLIKLLDNKRYWNRTVAAKVLGTLGKKALPALPALRKRLKDENPEVREIAAATIKTLSRYAKRKKTIV